MLGNQVTREQVAEDSLQFVIDIFAMLKDLNTEELNECRRYADIYHPGEFDRLVRSAYKIATACNDSTNNITFN